MQKTLTGAMTSQLPDNLASISDIYKWLTRIGTKCIHSKEMLDLCERIREGRLDNGYKNIVSDVNKLITLLDENKIHNSRI